MMPKRTSSPAWPARRLMFIGDSITCGEYLDRFPHIADERRRTFAAPESGAWR